MVPVGGSHGALFHKLQLRRAPGVSVPKVVSEGEARCLSIASFFAELSTAEDRSAILFDDPVSSLDDAWRRHVAERLVNEARSRQVIVVPATRRRCFFAHRLLKQTTRPQSPLIGKAVAMSPVRQLGFFNEQFA
jgi:wobble nucleotide-excising tRNase